MTQQRRLHDYPDTDAVVADLAVKMEATARQCIADHGYFRCVLAGGETPRRLYQRLRDIDADWCRWHIYFGDERCLPIGDAARNDHMAATAWLNHVAIPVAQIYPIPAECGPDVAAQAYAKTLTAVGNFDLVLLGIGEDGHTASLFPYMQQDLLNDPLTTAVHGSPKPPPRRVSISARRLSAADRVWFLVCGEPKRAALHDWLNDVALPAALIAPDHGVDIYTDLRH